MLIIVGFVQIEIMKLLTMMTMIFLSFPMIVLLNGVLPCVLLVNALPAPYELTPTQMTDFHKDGVIVIRGMLKGALLDDAIHDVNKIQRSRNVSQRILHKMFPAYRNLEFQTYRSHAALKRVAFDSTAPTICAKLMGLDDDHNNNSAGNNNENKNEKNGPQPRSLRLLKDAVLGFSKGDKGCGWHVDDKIF